MDLRIAKTTSLAALVLLTACGGGGSGPAPGEAPLDPTAITPAATAATAAVPGVADTTVSAAASAKTKVTPSMVRRVAAPPRPANGLTAVQPGLPDSPRRGDKAGNTQRSPTRVIDTPSTP
jgi:hypothetical protein